MGRRWAGPMALLLLAPWVGEYLLGNVPLGELPALPFLAPLYGGGALLIREVTRRTGRGWPTILLLGAAYGVIEAGLVDQSLFNQNYSDTTFLSAQTYVPALGLVAADGLSFVAGHAIWSIGTAIAFAEFLTPATRLTPWCGRRGLAATAALYLLGCWTIYRDQLHEQAFVASPGQRVGAVAAAMALMVAAFAIRPRAGGRADVDSPRPGADRPRRVPPPWALGAGAFVVLSVFFGRSESWAGVVLGVVLLAGSAAALLGWATLPAFGPGHEFAVASAALLTYAWGGFVLTYLVRPDDVLAWAGNALFAGLALVLIVAAGRRITSRPGVVRSR